MRCSKTKDEPLRANHGIRPVALGRLRLHVADLSPPLRDLAHGILVMRAAPALADLARIGEMVSVRMTDEGIATSGRNPGPLTVEMGLFTRANVEND